MIRTAAAPFLRTALPVALIVALAGCGGGGGGGGGTGNLGLTSFAVEHPDPNAGHEVLVRTGIESTRVYENVAVSYYLMWKTDVDQDSTDVHQFVIGSRVLPRIDPGNTVHVDTVLLPVEVDRAGEYYLAARIDPLDQIVETDEDDNVPGDRVPEHVVGVGRGFLDTPDFVLEDVVLDTEAILLEPILSFPSVGGITDKDNHHFGATAIVSTTGRNEVQNLDLAISIEVPGSGFEPLDLWDRDNSRYVREFRSVPLVPDEPNSIHCDVRIPESTRARLEQAVRAGTDTFTLRVETNKVAGYGEWELGSQRLDRDDDQIDLDVVCVLPAPPSQGVLDWRESFEKTWTNKYFGVGLSLEGAAAIDRRGAVGEARATLPVFLVGKRFELLDAELYSQTAPHDTSKSRYSADVRVLDRSIYSAGVTDPSYTYVEDFSKSETVEAKTTVWVGPVPITFTAGATGVVGFRAEFHADTAGLAISEGPYAEATAFGEAKVDLLVARGGVRGNMQIVRDDFVARAAAQVQVVGNGEALDGILEFDVTNTLVGPNGRIFLFAEYPEAEICAGFLPCGVKTKRVEKDLVKFSTFRKVDVLYQNRSSVRVNLVD